MPSGSGSRMDANSSTCNGGVELSTNEEKCLKGSHFRPPFHHPLIKSNSIYHSVTSSQDSFDMFHDAVSNLQREQSMVSSLNGTPILGVKGGRFRSRHASSGPRIDCDRVTDIDSFLTTVIHEFPHGSEEECSTMRKPETVQEEETATIDPHLSRSNIPSNSCSSIRDSHPSNRDSHSSSRDSRFSESPVPMDTTESGGGESCAMLPKSASNLSCRFCQLHKGSHKSKEGRTMEMENITYLNTRPKGTIAMEIKEEFALSNFKFNHRRPHLFVTSQWQRPNEPCCMYLAYRLFWGVYFSMWSVWSVVGYGGYGVPLHPGAKLHYLLYLTHWAIWLLAVDTMLQAVNVASHIKKIARDGNARYDRMTTRFKVSWILSNISYTIHVFVTLVFWTIIYSEEEDRRVTPILVNTRIIPCLYVCLDSVISATPRRVLHAYLPMMLLTVYGVMTDVYYLTGGKNREGDDALYPILDWSRPLQTLLLGSSLLLILIPVIHSCVVCLLSGAKRRLHAALNHTEYELTDAKRSFAFPATKELTTV